MTFGSNVGPRRRVRERPKSWRCCGQTLAGYIVRCPTCGRRRVDDQITEKRADAGSRECLR